MSWSFGVPATAAADFEQAASDAKDTYAHALEGQDYALDQIASGQADAAIKAAAQIVASGVVGSGKVQASLTGHANPDHKPTAGFANEMVTVSVSCADQYVAPPASATPTS